MRLFELLESLQPIMEVNMSPGALADFAKTEFAQSMTAGFETELIVPNVHNEYDDDDAEPEMDLEQDEDIHSTKDIMRFFTDDEANDEDDVQEAIDSMEEEFTEAADEKFEEDMTDEQLELAMEKAREDGMSPEEITDVFEQEIGRLYQKYMDAARDELYPDFINTYFHEWIRKNYRKMSNFADAFQLHYPHWRTARSENTKDIREVADAIKSSIGIEVRSTDGYHEIERGPGYFILETDSSIRADPKKNEGGLELVSPPMPLAETLEYLDKVFAWARSYGCKTDRSTGFHMGISIPGQTRENVDFVKFTMFLGDEYVLRQFKRQANEFTGSMTKVMSKNLRYMDVASVLEKFKSGLDGAAAEVMKRQMTATNTKYVSVNVRDKYIEVRSAGGNYLKDLEKIKLTLLRYMRALAIAADPEAERNEYAKKLYKFMSPMIKGEEDMIKLFSRYSAGEMTTDSLKTYIKQIHDARKKEDEPNRFTYDGPGTYAITYKDRRSGDQGTYRIDAESRKAALDIFRSHERARFANIIVVELDNDNTARSRRAAQQPAQQSTYYIDYREANGTTGNIMVIASSDEEAKQRYEASHPNDTVTGVRSSSPGQQPNRQQYQIRYTMPDDPKRVRSQNMLATSTEDAEQKFMDQFPGYNVVDIQPFGINR